MVFVPSMIPFQPAINKGGAGYVATHHEHGHWHGPRQGLGLGTAMGMALGGGGAAGAARAELGSQSGYRSTFWRPPRSHWRGCGGLVFCSFGAPTPPELMKKQGFLNAFEGIRGRPVGDACSRARR